MTLPVAALLIALAAVALVAVALFALHRHVVARLRALEHQNRSLSSRYGKLTEQFMPFIPDYPFDPHRFRFIGSPIDGVQFEDDRVLLIEFKSASSRLTSQQRHIRDLVRRGKVEFRELRLD